MHLLVVILGVAGLWSLLLLAFALLCRIAADPLADALPALPEPRPVGLCACCDTPCMFDPLTLRAVCACGAADIPPAFFGDRLVRELDVLWSSS